MHVDGFRFDLASVLSRDESGHPIDNPPVLWEIESDPVLAGTKIIAEAWDAAGLYQVGSFIGHRWSEWNGRYRDDVRRFVKSDSESVWRLASAIGGSRDLYSQPGREPNRSINFITAHDGFTLNDLVSYNEKHNHANGEHNRDGHNDNLSWNCGVEGPTDDAGIEALRLRQMKNFMTILMISQGTPMFMMGDEVRRTQGGNNNAYCQDNEISWFDWNDVPRNGELLTFVRRMIHFRRHHHLFYEEGFWVDPGEPEITWHGVELYQPDWGEFSRTLSFELCDRIRHEHMHVMLNAYWDALDFELPAPYHGTCWHRVVDTFLRAPDDFAEPPHKLPQPEHSYRVQPRSVVVLLALNCEPE
jgi:glycogen operon protein